MTSRFKHRGPPLGVFALFAAVLLTLSCATAPKGGLDPLIARSTAKGEWTTWGGDAGFQRYSPLDQINAANVGTLEVAWRWKMLPLGNRPDTNNKATPIMVGGVLYVPTGAHQVVALDPETGRVIWTYTPPPSSDPGRGLGLGSRSLAYWTDGKTARLFHNTLDGRLLAIDPATGKGDPAFGDNGQVFLKYDLGRDAPFVGSSSPPTVVGDVVVAQVIGDITAPQPAATPGFVRGFDVRTGKRLWTFHTVPQAGEFGNDTWGEESWKYTGNTGVWTMMSADPELGYIYLPVESPTHDFYGGHRPGANLFGESLVCLDAKTGKRVWHYQIVHHGLWDYDPPAAPILHDVVIKGKRIKAVTQLTKQGMNFVFNRVTGEPIWPIEERPAPQLAVPGDRQWPTQPIPTRPAPYSKLGYHEDDLIDFTPELRREALAIAQRYERGPLYTPPIVPENGKLGTWVYPSYQGGANWNGGAFDPDTGMLYVPTRNTVMAASLGKADPKVTSWRFTRPATRVIDGPRGLPINKPPWSQITATDMNRGVHVWSKAIGGAPVSIRNNPALKGLNLDFDGMGQPNIRPGPLVTKTLLFLAEAGGLSGDPGGPMFRAYDKATGKVIAEIEMPAKVTGIPMTYLAGGRQYIVMSVGTQQHPAELVALALPDPSRPKAASPVAAPAAPAARPAFSLGPEELAAGRQVYARACAACHGLRGEGREGQAPAIANYADFPGALRIVQQGGVEMPSMRNVLIPAEQAAVSRYVAGGGLNIPP